MPDFVMPDFPPLPEPLCAWIATCDRRELVRALPQAGEPVPLSRVAWQLSDPRARRLIVFDGDALRPWRLDSAGRDEARAVQRAAIARGAKPMRLDGREEEVHRAACNECFGARAVAALLPLLRRHGVVVSGVAESGVRVPIDPLLLATLAFDLARDMAWTGDNACLWRALAATRPVAAAAGAPVRKPVPQRRTVQSELARWYRETYPAGHPVGRKLDMLAFEAAQRLGRTVSTRTMRRALVEVRRTDAAN